MIYLPPFKEPLFPSVEEATEDGIVAIGGRLNTEWLIEAYSRGIFPWFNEGEPIMWWSPDPRAVMKPSEVKVHKSMNSYFNQKKYQLKIDSAFEKVIGYCSNVPREGQDGTWINSSMIDNYIKLHNKGFTHSFETWENDILVGGLYGISLGKAFFGESMFSLKTNASKFAFISMCRILEKNEFNLIDCQVHTNHIESMGCKMISRKEFLKLVTENNKKETLKGNWNELLLR
ncbi:MAG: leucyl/phenylalanyl-tRNA--protein transferase [Bacteroidales bacterium]|nr:leucyl/phenylalanyl-tRNA--protein transferase [Bacteroidales bacterium]